jgi:RNA polymerase sigma-70 factor (TIGR02960 family)
VTRAAAGDGHDLARHPPCEPGDEPALLSRARAGDQAAFGNLVAPYEAELRLHCYRMLGSFHDAEDVTQEVLVRAWRHLSAFEGRASVRTWLYRIATNRCLTRRARRVPEAPAGAAFAPPPPNAPDVEVTELQPFPDARLGELMAPAPDAIYDLRESVSLAFLTVIQLLPARQRAVLLLRDVLGFSAAETAALLDMTVAAANSALQRARAALGPQHVSGRLPRRVPATDDQAERRLLDRYLAAWHANDVPALLALLREDALLTMPPFPAAYRGRHAIGQFLRTVPAGGRLDQIALIPVSANLQPAVAAYVRDADESSASVSRAYGIMVLTADGDRISEITGFADPALFPVFDLPPRLEL